MLSIVWFSGKVPSPCCLCLGFQARRDLHAVYNLARKQSAVSMMSIIWVSDKCALHDVYGLGFWTNAVSMLPVIWISGKRGLHAACDLDIGQTRSPCCL
jgi:hypothetical protein